MNLINPLSETNPLRLVAYRFACFTGVGFVGTLVHYLVLIILVMTFDVRAVIGSTVGLIMGALINYILNHHFTFRSNKSHPETLVKFLMVASVGLVLNAFIMLVATEILGLHYLLSQIAATGLVLVWNFTGNSLWTFREGNGGTRR